MTTAIAWFRNDLRLEANPAFARATSLCDHVVPLVVVDPSILDAVGPFRRAVWLANVAALARDLEQLGGTLNVVEGRAVDAIAPVARSLQADAIFVNNPTSGFGTARDRTVEAASVGFDRSWGTLVTAPGTVLTQNGTLSRVFTPFAKKWAVTPLAALPQPGSADLVAAAGLPTFELPSYDSDQTIRAGNQAAHEVLHAWLESVDEYTDTRDLPAIPGTSELSAHLRFGTISPRTVLDIVGTSTPGRESFVRQLAWRDWYAHLLVEMPTMITQAVRTEYDRIEWLDDPAGLDAWKAGRTGYPLVDAGMRQLAETGWMHNRVRMIVGSFLVKDLLIDWREGERWFRHLLIDGEPSQNAGNWQWVAGTGTDAAPYFRIFNPISQSRKFDADGTYIRRWVPELAGLNSKAIHAPWEAAPLDLAAAGVILGDTYPAPIVDHAFARERTLAAYKAALG